MNDDAEWEVIEVSLVDETTGKPSKLKGIQNKSGFLLVCTGINREKIETYLARGSFGEFKFLANRWDLGEEKPLDTYTIYTQSFPYSELGNRNKQLCLDYSREIEYSLLHLPVDFPFFKNKPVKNVLFDLGKTWTDHVLVKAQELSNGR